MTNKNSVFVESKRFELHVFADRVIIYFEERQAKEKLEKLNSICQNIDEDIVAYVS
jgi:methyl coenzyme M reductase subunit D